MIPPISWRKELPRTFYVNSAGIFLLLCLSILLMSLLAFGFIFEFTTSILIWLLFFSLPTVWVGYFIIVWMYSIQNEMNSAFFEQNAVFLRRSNYRDPYVWSLGALVLLPAWYFLLWSYALFVDTEESLRRQILLHPATVILVVVCCFILLPVASLQAPGKSISLRLDPRGIELLYGSRSGLNVEWESIKDMHLQASGMQVIVHLESDAIQHVKRNILGAKIGGQKFFDVKGFDTEPNAILRVVRECIRNPDAREVLGTREGVDFVTFGPSWKQVQKMKLGETWSGDDR